MTNEQKFSAKVCCVCGIGVLLCVLYATVIGDGCAKVAKAAMKKESQLIEMNISAYCPCEKCCGKWADGITASGHKIQLGDKFIAAPPKYPFGTLMDIPGYGKVPVLDRGGAIKGNKLDVFFDTHQEALNWGRQYLKVRTGVIR